MVLGVDELHKRVKREKLVENLSTRELTNPEGAGFDLRVGKVSQIFGTAFIGIDERNSCDSKILYEYKENKKQSFVIKPGECLLLTTIEKVNMPNNLTAKTWLRSTYYRSGIILSGGNIAPGYCGELSCLIYNCGNVKVEIELGARFMHIIFWEISGKTNLYRGQWQNGRVTTNKREKQV